ncbi:MAG: hypothetical protein MJZ65_03745 [Paludibacteraceae bacterium]|nr:hypothetical protein [Paludibacteraceae bacterium]
MRKLLFILAAVYCLVMNSWADCQLIGNEIPSGTGVKARSIINIQYNQTTQILSFEDIYEPSFTAYERMYQVYFYKYQSDYAFYRNPSGGYNSVFYGAGCDDDAFIPGNPSSSAEHPSAHRWTYRTVNNSAGGTIQIDLSTVVSQLAALGYNHVMVGIYPSCRISSSADWVYYSTYGDRHSWLMNTAHFKIIPLVDRRIDGLVTKVHTPTGVIDNTGWGSPFEAEEHVYLCDGQDTANVRANISPISNVTGPVTYIWQKRTDDETAWHYQSQGSFSKTQWNNAVSSSTALQVNRNFRWSAGDMERVTYFRLALAYDNDTLYSNEIQIDAKFRVKITGPVACKFGDEAWKNINIKGAYPIFDTLTYEVDMNDTIRLKPYKSNWSFAEMYCSIPVRGIITTDSEGNPCITDFWHSCYTVIRGETHSVKLYVDGTLYHSFNEVPCSFTIKECNYPAPADPTKSGVDFLYWRPRDGSGTAGLSYITNHIVIGDEEWDAVFSDEKYALYVKGTQVTSNNKNTIAPGVTYNSERKELTLTNANIVYDGTEVIDIYQDITINCIGENTVYCTSTTNGSAIGNGVGKTTITGSGTLLAKSDAMSAIYGEYDLTISDGCKVTAQSAKGYAIAIAGEPLTIDNATLIAKGNGKEATINGCSELIMLNGVSIRSAHTYDAATHKFLDAAGNEAKDDIIIGVAGTGTGLEELTVDNARCTMRKMIIDNQLYILRNNKLYNAAGGRVK